MTCTTSYAGWPGLLIIFLLRCNSAVCLMQADRWFSRQMAPSQRRRPRSASTTASNRNTRQRLLQSAEATPPNVECGSQAASCGGAAPTAPRPSAADTTLTAAAAAAGAGVPLPSSQAAAQPQRAQPTSQPDHAGPASGTRSRTLRRVQSCGSQTQLASPALQTTASGQGNVATGSHLGCEAVKGASPLQQGNGGTGSAATAPQPQAVPPSLQLAPPSEQHRQQESTPHPSNLAAAERGGSNPSNGADATAVQASPSLHSAPPHSCLTTKAVGQPHTQMHCRLARLLWVATAIRYTRGSISSDAEVMTKTTSTIELWTGVPTTAVVCQSRRSCCALPPSPASTPSSVSQSTMEHGCYWLLGHLLICQRPASHRGRVGAADMEDNGRCFVEDLQSRNKVDAVNE